jgi:hypothetical protein
MSGHYPFHTMLNAPTIFLITYDNLNVGKTQHNIRYYMDAVLLLIN